MKKQHLLLPCPHCKKEDAVVFSLKETKDTSSAKVSKCSFCGYQPGMKELNDYYLGKTQ